MDFSLEFNEFYYGKDDFDQKSLMKGLDLVTSRLYAERKTDDLIWFWMLLLNVNVKQQAVSKAEAAS